MSHVHTSDAAAEALMGEIVDEFLERLARGERPEIEEYLRRYPQLAAVLRQMLPALQVIHPCAGEPLRPAEQAIAGIEPEGPLGDFRIVREIGRGGMGVVYEAVQISLGRRVALKVLPFAAGLDERQLQRFKNEAQAAAHLHHQNIVPVYYVGCERGVHFYAMQFIPGRTLAEVIGGLRTGSAGRAGPPSSQPGSAEEQAAPGGCRAEAAAAPDTLALAGLATERSTRRPEFFRTVARLGVQAAEALEHAHQEGIIHRDVKPANLLMDARGNLWVTDFGLARLRNDNGLTASGDLVGTLRYMSPEQALGQPAAVDQRTDVYSLGATLYELLVLSPVFEGRDRQELVRRIATEEPRPPRRLNPLVPAELEVIVLKTLEKEARARYATAQELADDLRRFLEDKPIRARRPSWLEQARKWTRRHRSAVWTATVSLLAALAVLAGSVGWVVRDGEARRARTADDVQAAMREARGFQREGKWPEARAAAIRAEALLANGGGSEELRRGVRGLQADLRMVGRLEEVRMRQSTLKDGHFNNEGADHGYEEAFRDYGIDVEALDARVAAKRIATRTIRVELATALDDWARTRCWFPQSGRKSWRDLLAVARLADDNADRSALREALLRGDRAKLAEQAAAPGVDRPPVTLILLGDALADMGRLREAIALLRQAQEQYPGDFWINHQLAFYLNHTDPAHREEAVRFYTAAVAVRPRSAGACLNLGNALAGMGRWAAALAAYRQAVQLNPRYAEAHCNAGNILWDIGRHGEAVGALRKAIKLKPELAEAHGNLGVALVELGRHEEAVTAFRTAIRLFASRMGNGSVPGMVSACNNLGIALDKMGRLEEAVAAYRQAIELQPDAMTFFNLGRVQGKLGRHEEAVETYRRAIERSPHHAAAYCNLGVSLGRLGRHDEEVAAFRRAVALNPDLVTAHFNLGVTLTDQGRPDEAMAVFQKVIRRKPDNPTARYELGRALLMLGKLGEAITANQQAIALKPDYAEAHCNLGCCLRLRGEFARALAATRRGHELGSRRRNWPYPSARWVRECRRLLALDGREQAVLRGKLRPADADEENTFAELCYNKKLFAASTRLRASAFRADPKLADDLEAGHRYQGAGAAALAAAGRGEDASRQDDAQRARWRKLALGWLRADLAANANLLKGRKPADRCLIRQRLRQWQWDQNLASLRDPAALAGLPPREQEALRQLWADVAALLAQAEAVR